MDWKLETGSGGPRSGLIDLPRQEDGRVWIETFEPLIRTTETGGHGELAETANTKAGDGGRRERRSPGIAAGGRERAAGHSLTKPVAPITPVPARVMTATTPRPMRPRSAPQPPVCRPALERRPRSPARPASPTAHRPSSPPPPPPAEREGSDQQRGRCDTRRHSMISPSPSETQPSARFESAPNLPCSPDDQRQLLPFLLCPASSVPLRPIHTSSPTSSVIGFPSNTDANPH